MPVYPGIIASAEEAAASPGALPAWNSVGALTVTTTFAATHTIAHPTTVATGDLLVSLGLLACTSDAGLAMAAAMSSAGWAHLTGSPWVHSTSSFTFLVAWKMASGSEGGTNVPGGIVGSGTGTGRFLGMCHRFTAADGFRVSPSPFESISIAENASTSRPMPTVTPTGANRRAVAILAFSSNNQNVAGAVGETGGDWIEAWDDNGPGVALQIQVQTSDQSGGGAISGGTTTSDKTSNTFILGFALVPALV